MCYTVYQVVDAYWSGDIRGWSLPRRIRHSTSVALQYSSTFKAPDYVALRLAEPHKLREEEVEILRRFFSLPPYHDTQETPTDKDTARRVALALNKLGLLTRVGPETKLYAILSAR